MTTPLRAKYIRDLAIRGRAERTQQSYFSELARYYHRSPELISYQEVADWLYLPDQGAGTFGFQRQHRCQCRTLSLRRYPRSEVEAILSAPRQPRDRVFLMTVYACGSPPIAKLVASALKWENPSTVKDRQSPNARVD